MLNPDLDIEALANSYMVDKRLAINNFLQVDVAEQIHSGCVDSVPYEIQYVLDGKYQSMSRAEAAQSSPEQQHAINGRIMTAACQGVGFLYDGYLKSKVKTTPDNMLNDQLVFLHDVFRKIGGEDILSLISKITGETGINGAEPQYTRYTPGHFLTRHRDIVGGRDRRIAFVLGLTKGWHPDWGGLLQFYQEDGTPRDAWTPQFNVLSIFDVSHIHSVTYVAPYAGAARYSMTGWFVARD